MNRVDDEFAGKHGTVLTDASLRLEQAPDNHSQSPSEVAEKVAEETRQEGGGPLGALKAVWKEADRQLGAEYELREDPDATASPQSVSPEQGPRGTAGAAGAIRPAP